VLAQQAGEDLLARLTWMTLKPNIILDVGCGTGMMRAQLQTQYPEAQIIAIDSSTDMIEFAKQQASTAASFFISAEASALPYPDRSVDLIFANLLLPWHANQASLLREWRRVLRPDGLLLFNALGLDTLKEWRAQAGDEHLPVLFDMHDLGDLLLQQGFADPVLDVDYYTLTYRSKEKLAHELSVTGMLALSSADILAQEKIAAIPKINDTWHITYEIIYAHAFAPFIKTPENKNTQHEVRVPLSQLKRK